MAEISSNSILDRTITPNPIPLIRIRSCSSPPGKHVPLFKEFFRKCAEIARTILEKLRRQAIYAIYHVIAIGRRGSHSQNQMRKFSSLAMGGLIDLHFGSSRDDPVYVMNPSFATTDNLYHVISKQVCLHESVAITRLP
jgi:hypothetical protein